MRLRVWTSWFVVLGSCGVPDPGGPPITDDSVEESGGEESDTELDSDVVSDAVLELGTGTFGVSSDCSGFIPVVDGEGLAMVHGPQGGWHLDVSLRGHGLPEFAVLETVIVDIESGIHVSMPDPIRHNLRLVSESGGEWNGSGCYLGLLGVFDPTRLESDPNPDAPFEVILGRSVEVRMKLGTGGDDRGFSSVEASMVVVVQPDPCFVDLRSPGCPCDPEASFRPFFCEQEYEDPE